MEKPPPNKDSFSIKDPLTSEMRAKVARMLKQKYISSTNQSKGMEIKLLWTTEFDGMGMFRLDRSITPTLPVRGRSLRKFFNKPTAFYWAHSAQHRDRCELFPFACIYKEWYHHHETLPNFRFEHFFANPVRITSKGPTAIAAIRDSHRSICDQASLLLDMIRWDRPGGAHLDDLLAPRDYILFPLCRAVIIIFDEILSPGVPVCLETEVERQTALLVRTGDEDGLSAPITFDPIRSQSLPLARSDVTAVDSENVIRVSLRTAVLFVLNLQRREERAFPLLRRSSRYRSVEADEHVADVLRLVDDVGCKNPPEFSLAVREIEYRERGEPCDTTDFAFWSPSWT